MSNRIDQTITEQPSKHSIPRLSFGGAQKTTRDRNYRFGDLHRSRLPTALQNHLHVSTSGAALCGSRRKSGGMATGQAAGLTAALSIKAATTPRDLNSDTLQNELRLVGNELGGDR